MTTLGLAVDRTLAVPVGERYPAFPAGDYSADMLQRTTRADPWPDRLDYLVVERIAHDMRNQYIASLFRRAKNALAKRFAKRARAARLS
jgi:hypothetical protein